MSEHRIEAPWAKMPLHVAADDALVLGDIRVYAALDYLAGKRGWWYGSQEQIAAIAGTSTDTVFRAVTHLRERGHISTVKLGLEKRNVLRYMIHARTLGVDDIGATRVDAVDEPAPMRETVNRTDAVGKDTDLPQTSTTDSLSPRARTSEEWFVSTTGRSARLPGLKQILADIDAAHPAECVKWVWEGSAGANEPWAFAKAKFDRCLMEGHGPQRGSNGTSKQRIRAGAGRGAGRAPNLIDKWDAYLAEHPNAGLREEVNGVGGAAGDVGGDV